MKKAWRKGLASIIAFAVMAVSTVAMAVTPVHAASKGVTLYFQNSKNWKSVYCYVWYGSGGVGKAWPGVQMTKVAGTSDWYEFTYTGDKPINAVFNDNGKPKPQQTADQNPKDLPLTQDAYWFTLSSTTSQNASGEGGGVNMIVHKTAEAGYPTAAAASASTTTTATTTATAKDTTPKTGDSSNAAAVAVIGAAALSGAAVAIFRKKVAA